MAFRRFISVGPRKGKGKSRTRWTEPATKKIEAYSLLRQTDLVGMGYFLAINIHCNWIGYMLLLSALKQRRSLSRDRGHALQIKFNVLESKSNLKPPFGQTVLSGIMMETLF